MSGFTDKLGDLEDKHDKQVDQAVAKAGEEADKRTDEKYSEQVEQVDKGVQEAQKRD
ncbi:antitoxin [Candidatus Frankia alpina]|uniref:Antitoxin n=1 Tax=Candidatus Frankia alpina TaxID=2699483 RepID=A0A4S5ECF4_9ACTN|nr:antitoxin [Candidatus Frankia alpina]THJ69350.1 antitoxin [Candidatus Frankia alpina]